MQDKTYKIKNTPSGNCGCGNCGRTQPGLKLQPYTVWYKYADEKRGHNMPMCSKECAERFVKNSLPTMKRIKVDTLF